MKECSAHIQLWNIVYLVGLGLLWLELDLQRGDLALKKTPKNFKYKSK